MRSQSRYYFEVAHVARTECVSPCDAENCWTCQEIGLGLSHKIPPVCPKTSANFCDFLVIAQSPSYFRKLLRNFQGKLRHFFFSCVREGPFSNFALKFTAQGNLALVGQAWDCGCSRLVHSGGSQVVECGSYRWLHKMMIAGKMCIAQHFF